MTAPLVLPRTAFLDALADRSTEGPVGSRLAPIFEAGTAIAIARCSNRVAMWVDRERTVVATGDDPVTITAIKAVNTTLAVIDSIDLRRGGGVRTGSWWQIRIATSDKQHRIEGYDRSPGPTWLVVDAPHATRVRPATIPQVASTICRAVEEHIGPLPPPSLA